jgi:hypothetical protein
LRKVFERNGLALDFQLRIRLSKNKEEAEEAGGAGLLFV